MSKDQQKFKLSADERKQDILRHAARLFALKGLDGASMRDIAGACNVNEALIYRHFDNKEALYREAVFHVGSQIDGQLRSIADKEKTGIDALREILKALLFGPDEILHVYAFLVHGLSASTQDAEVKELVRGGFTQLHALINEIIDHGVADKTIKNDIDTSHCAWCVLSRGLASRILTTIMPSDVPMSSSGGDLMETLLGCLKPPAQAEVD